MESILQDIRYGARMLCRNRDFTTVAVLALALGIGVNTALFTAWKAMVARPLDASNPGAMVNLALLRSSGDSDFAFSYPDYVTYRDSSPCFTGLIAASPEHMILSRAGGIVSQRRSAASSVMGRLGLLSAGSGNAEFASVFAVSENYFQVLGVPALRGRTFESIAAPELTASPSVLISENYWQKRFGGDPAVLGKGIRLNGAAVTIVGITPHDFAGTGVAVPDFWLPLSLEPLVHADSQWLQKRESQCCRLFGRLAPGIDIRQAQAQMTALATHVRALHDPHSRSAKPGTLFIWPGSPFPLPLKSYVGLMLAISLIVVAAAMVLAVACANVASLQLARSRARADELRTRLSLGAGRLRLIRQLLTESALLGLLAGATALPFTWLLLKISLTLMAGAIPAEYGTLIFNVNPDIRILACVLAISLGAGILFGLAPAIQSARSALASGVRGGTSTAGSRRLQDFLVTAQVALSLTLMIAGSMLIHSSIHSLTTPTGYDGKHVVALDLRFPENSGYTADRKAAVIHELRTRLAALPGIADVTSALAPDDHGFQTAAAAQGKQSLLHYTYIQENYFRTLNIPLFLGHTFQTHGEASGYSAVLSQSAAERLWPGQNPLGRAFRLGLSDERFHNGGEPPPDGPAYHVIGVARDTRGVEFDGSDSRQVYLPLPEAWLATRTLLIRTRSDPSQITAALDAAISSVDPDLVTDISTLDEMLHRTPPFVVSSMAAAIATAVGLIGLLLASMGIYGTVSYIVVLRTREVGIRIAVGAGKRDILSLILRESIRPVLTGLAAGMVLAVGASYVLRGLLYGVASFDPISFGGVSLMFLAVALLAAYPPSRRALRVDPVTALRYE